MGVERCAHPYRTAVVGFHQHRLVLGLPFGIPVAVFHLAGLVFQRYGEIISHRDEVLRVVQCILYVCLQAVGCFHETFIRAFVSEGVDKQVAEHACVGHGECYFDVFH